MVLIDHWKFIYEKEKKGKKGNGEKNKEESKKEDETREANKGNLGFKSSFKIETGDSTDDEEEE